MSFDDWAIQQITLIAAWIHYINRAADVFGGGNMSDMPIDYPALQQEIVRAARLTFTEVKAQRPNETFIVFGLETDSDVVVLEPFAATIEDLQRKVRETGDGRYSDFFWWPVQELPLWHACKSHLSRAEDIVNRYTSEDIDSHTEELFRERKRSLLNVFCNALGELDREGLFGVGAAREKVLVYIDNSDPDLDDFAMLLCLARRLNPPASLVRYEERARQIFMNCDISLESQISRLKREGLI